MATVEHAVGNQANVERDNIGDEHEDLKALFHRAIEATQQEQRYEGPNANLFDSRLFNQCYRVAKSMAAMSILPDHLKYDGNPKNGKRLSQEAITANCFRIVNQAIRWDFDPYAIVDETFVVGGKLGYTGKLVAAVVNSRAGLKGRLTYEHSGTGDNRKVVVRGYFRDSPDAVHTIELSVKDAKTDNQMWRKDPDQKLCYSGATKWARRHCPEVILGVLTDDDLERIQETKRDDDALGDLSRKMGDDKQASSGTDEHYDMDTGDLWPESDQDDVPISDRQDD